MPSDRACSTERSSVSSPLMISRPSSGRWKPEMIFISVDLPAPLSPSSPSTSPWPRCRLISCSAVTGPNRLATFSTRRQSSAKAAPLTHAPHVHVDYQCHKDGHAEHKVEVVGVDALDRQAVAQHPQEQGAE